MSDFSLTRQDTSAMKGIAICAMLCHHLYAFPPIGVESYTGVLAWLGELGKVCVALFLFCSGYGLSVGYSKVNGIKSTVLFIRNRLVKFYTNYWVILLIFIPIGVFVLGRTFSVAYSGMNVPKRILYEIFAINGGCSYVQTWWFNQLIIIFYLVFPLLYAMLHRIPIITISLSVLYLIFGDRYTFGIIELNAWQCPFILGILWNAIEEYTRTISAFLTNHKYVGFLLSILFVTASVFIRMNPIIPGYTDINADSMFAISIVFFVIILLRQSSKAMQIFSFLGKHSMNIYLIHPFVTLPILCGNNILIGVGKLLVWLTVCLTISMLIEYLKEKTKYNEFVQSKLIKNIEI